MPTLLHDRFTTIFGTRRGTIHDPLVEAAIKRIPSLTNHMARPCRETVRLLIQDACLEQEGALSSAQDEKSILMFRGAPGGFRSSLAISVKEWIGEGHGYTGWKAALELAQGGGVSEVGPFIGDAFLSLEPISCPLIIEQLAYSLINEWEWLGEAIDAQDIL